MKKVIHVNQHAIRRNTKRPPDQPIEPVITVKTYKSNHYGHAVEIEGASRVIYRPDKPLSCGARVWVETDAPVRIDGVEVS